jgi:lipopolysaccharide export system permease protein
VTVTARPAPSTRAPAGRRAPPAARPVRLRIGPLDRYVFLEWVKIFVTTALGFPVLVIVIDLTDHLETYLQRNIPTAKIALSYLYWVPGSMFLVLPAAVLFATVFSIGAFTRHSEITAAKASGLSFYRMTAPIFLAACLAAVLGLGIGELAPVTNAKHDELLQEQQFRGGNERYNFAYAAEEGRVYKVGALDAAHGTMTSLEIERRGLGRDYPTYIVTAQTATWHAPRGSSRLGMSAAQRGTQRGTSRGWTLGAGSLHFTPDSIRDFAVLFDSARDNHLREAPGELMATPKNPEDMRFEDLRRFIGALQRSGGNADELKVELAQKIAVPVTCIIIALFGAPLATTTQRGGAAYGIAISLATTVLFLMMIQLTKAVGAKGLIPPYLAAWVPNVIFSIAGIYLLARVRT